MNASEFFEQLERDREELFTRKRRSRAVARVEAIPKRLDLDHLTRNERAAYDTGAWLGPSVRSVELNNEAFTDHSIIAELCARIRVQLERQQEAGVMPTS